MKKSIGEKAFDVLMYGCIGISILLILYPLYFILIASISDQNLVANGRVFLIPKGIQFGGFKRVFENDLLLSGYRNTILYTALGTVVNMVLTIPAAYALSRKDFLPRRVLMFLFVFTMYFSGGLVPTYLLMKDLRLLNTIWVMIIPFAVNVTNLIIARSFFESSIPDELLEAAVMDGCSNTKFFLHIVLPLSKAILAVITLYYAVQHWNEYFNALIYLKDTALYPLQLVIRDILVMNQKASASASAASSAVQIAEQVKYAVILISTVPVMIFFPFVQKYFMKGVMIGAVKG
ncbi:carbohydrate ABC transporter permease [Eisenbergiella tayi]|nr:carbohydrate ABC transporter permease [Eisenbergiella tayi]